ATMTPETYHALIEQQRATGSERFVLPVSRRLSADLLTPVSAFLTLRQHGRYCFLLESVEGGETLARYSFLGKNPYCIVRAHGEQVSVESERAAFRNGQAPKGTIYEVLQALLDRYEQVTIPGLPRLTGGAVGYLSYDTVRLLEDLPDAPPDDLDLPDAIWCFYDTVVAFDHVKHQLVLLANVFIEPHTDLERAYAEALERLEALEHELGQGTFAHPEPVRLDERQMTSNVESSAFEAAEVQDTR